MAPFHVRSRVCIASIDVRSKLCKFAPHIDGCNADFAPPMDQRHSFRDKIISKTAIFANFQSELLKTTNILGVYMTNVTTFDSTNMFSKSIFK